MTEHPPMLRIMRTLALIVIVTVVITADMVAFAESFRGLLTWAQNHSVYGAWAVLWPLQVDAFIMIGEAVLFIATIDGWNARGRVLAWAVTAGGLVVSVWGNTGHVTGAFSEHATAAVPPIAAFVGLALGIQVAKRVSEAHRAAPAPATVTAGIAESPEDDRPALPTATTGAEISTTDPASVTTTTTAPAPEPTDPAPVVAGSGHGDDRSPDAETANLAEMASDAERVRHAMTQLPPGATVGNVVAWLADRGQTVDPETARSAMRRARHARPADHARVIDFARSAK